MGPEKLLFVLCSFPLVSMLMIFLHEHYPSLSWDWLAGCNIIAELAHGSRHVAGLWPSKYFLSVLSCAALKLLDLQLGTVSPQSGWPIAAGSQAAAGPAREMNVAKI